MIQANDLMNGNYLLYYDEDENQNIPVKIVNIDDSGWVFYEFPDGTIQEGWCKDLYTIPITVEILKQNGFEIQEQGGGRMDVWTGCGPDAEGDIEIEFDNGVPKHLKIDATYKGEYYTSNNIHFVHQLQNIFHNCGIDKKIIIF